MLPLIGTHCVSTTINGVLEKYVSPNKSCARKPNFGLRLISISTIFRQLQSSTAGLTYFPFIPVSGTDVLTNASSDPLNPGVQLLRKYDCAELGCTFKSTRVFSLVTGTQIKHELYTFKQQDASSRLAGASACTHPFVVIF